MSWLGRLPLRILVPLVFGGFAILVSGLTYLNTRPGVYANVLSQASARLKGTLTETQAAIELLLRAGEFDSVKDLVATLGSVRGHRATALVDEDGLVLASTSLRESGQLATRLFPNLDPAQIARIKVTGGASVTHGDDGKSISGYVRVCEPGLTGLRSRKCGFLYYEQSLAAETGAAAALLKEQTMTNIVATAAITLLFLWLLSAVVNKRVRKLVSSARAFANGDTSVRTGLYGGDEFAEVGRALDAMLETVVQDRTQLAQAEQTIRQSHQELSESFAELRQLSGAMHSVRDQERRRLARELHDDMGQLLAAMRMDIGALSVALPDGAEAAHKLLQSLEEISTRAVESSRRLIEDLRPAVLEECSLADAVEELCVEFSRRHEIPHHFINSLSTVPNEEHFATPVYRLVQESLNNVAKHADAAQVTVELGTDEQALHIVIEDDGRGMPQPDQVREGAFGVMGMRERTIGLGGEFIVDSPGDKGTRVRAWFPLNQSQPDGHDEPWQSERHR